VVRKSGSFEVRDYAALTLVSTPMDKSNPENDGSFMRLFRYISGSNEATQKIAMTTPVFIDQRGTNRQMSFVVPRETAEKGVPESGRDDVRVTTRAVGRFAAYRFSGSWDAARVESARTKLAEWLAAENLQPVGEPEVANYDPPFTPPFLRRNEILVRLSSPPK